MSKDHVVLVTVACVMVTVVFTGLGVLVVVGRKTEGVVIVDGLNVVVAINVLMDV